jgi:LacI family repressor for deo operon, udp, cdd, tsx, nupC, and nupG
MSGVGFDFRQVNWLEIGAVRSETRQGPFWRVVLTPGRMAGGVLRMAKAASTTQGSAATRPAKAGPSIREIAKHAGVSPSTVSRVINGRDTGIPIAEQTRQVVLQACEALRYQPNIHAQRLFAGRSNSIAVMIPPHGKVLPGAASYTDPNLVKTLAGIMDESTDRDQHLLLVTSSPRVIERDEHLKLFRSRSIDGMLIWGAVASDWNYLSQLQDEGRPILLVNGCVQNDDVPYVSVDNRRGGQRAAVLLAKKDRPTAIAGVGDLVAIGAIEAADAMGLRVPQDLSVTGADDAFEYHKPRLTTFRTPMEELGRKAVGLLLSILDDPQAWPAVRNRNEHVVQGQLVLGRTTASPSVCMSDCV